MAHSESPCAQNSPAVGSEPSVPAPRGPVDPPAAGKLRQQVTYRQSGAAVLTVSGAIDAATVPRLAEMLQSRLCSQLTRLVLDLSPVEFLAVTGIGTLRAADHRAQCSATTLVIVTGDNRAVTRALQATAGHHSLLWQPGPVTSALAADGDDPAGR